MPDEIYGVMAVKNGQKQTIMNLSNARQKSYADLQNMTDAQKKGVIICPDYPKGAFLVQADQVGYGSGSVKDALDTMPKKIGYVTVDISGIAINMADSGWYYTEVAIPNIPTGATCFSAMLGNFDANVIVNVGSGNKIVLQSPVKKTMPTPRYVIVFYYL